MAKKRIRPNASKEQILIWMKTGIFRVEGEDVLTQKGKKLATRIHTRCGMEDGDPRVDLYYDGKRASIHVSHMVWMFHTQMLIPENFEIHHDDENPRNNKWENLICIHKLDHNKIHRFNNDSDLDNDSVPF